MHSPVQWSDICGAIFKPLVKLASPTIEMDLLRHVSGKEVIVRRLGIRVRVRVNVKVGSGSWSGSGVRGQGKS